MVLKYICVLVSCCKGLDASMYTTCQSICINVETLLESFLSIYFTIYFSLDLLIHLIHIMADFSLAVRILKDNLSFGFESRLIIPFSMLDPD